MQITNDVNTTCLARRLLFVAPGAFIGERRGMYGTTLDFGLEVEFLPPEGASINSSVDAVVLLRGEFSNFDIVARQNLASAADNFSVS